MTETYDVVLPFRPVYAERIYSGRKSIEWRTRGFKKNIKRVWIYETVPVSRVTGYFIPGERLGPYKNISEVITLFGMKAVTGDEHSSFMEPIALFGSEPVFGVRIQELYKLSKPVKVGELGLKRPPAGAVYIKSLEGDIE